MEYRNLTGHNALDLLKEGNRRFTMGTRSIEPLLSTSRLKEYAEKGQFPFATVLTCSDSRVPAEIVFDRGVGDLFVVRVAGNVVAPSLLASMEFAALNFQTPLILVMGHTRCGAVKATLDAERGRLQAPSQNLAELIEKIKPAARFALKKKPTADEAELLTMATLHNVEHSIHALLEQSPILKGLHQEGKLMLAGAIYQLETGQVEFLRPNETASDKITDASNIAQRHLRPADRLA